jgi:hypothetical protein
MTDNLGLIVFVSLWVLFVGWAYWITEHGNK